MIEELSFRFPVAYKGDKWSGSRPCMQMHMYLVKKIVLNKVGVTLIIGMSAEYYVISLTVQLDLCGLNSYFFSLKNLYGEILGAKCHDRV